MRSFILTFSFWMLIFNVSLVPVDSASIFDKDIIFRPVSITIDGVSVRKCRSSMSSNFAGFIQYYIAGYGRFVFSGVSFPRAEQVAEVDGNVLEVQTGMVDLVIEMKEPVLREAERGVL